MEIEYIDVNEVEKRFRQALARFEQRPDVSEGNKELLKRFLRESFLGKTNPGRAKKRVGFSRLQGYLNYLSTLIRFVRKDLDQVTQGDMEGFIEALERNEILSIRPIMYGRSGWKVANTPFSKSHKLHLKMAVRKFYRWLLGNNREYPPLVDWIEVLPVHQEIPALTEEEVRQLLGACSRTVHRALIQMLFDGGFRIAELLNVRLCHVQLQCVDEEAGRKCFLVRIPFSKTMPRTIVLPMETTTRWLSLWLAEHPAQPEVREDGTIQCDQLQAQLFPMPVKRARTILKTAGKRALAKRVYPHLIRHTSATYWANRLPYFKFCKRFGWTLTSKMPQRYIDRQGIDDLDVARIYRQTKTPRQPQSAPSLPCPALEREEPDPRQTVEADGPPPLLNERSEGRGRAPTPQAPPHSDLERLERLGQVLLQELWRLKDGQTENGTPAERATTLNTTPVDASEGMDRRPREPLPPWTTNHRQVVKQQRSVGSW
ncbi:tyrosine-type recombinase/integrase [Candidatus Woesearchaeota archaeon]|nr:tyrosine-type recombinase/integrase [Candidatus Woesearchaeota archaeon]